MRLKFLDSSTASCAHCTGTDGRFCGSDTDIDVAHLLLPHILDHLNGPTIRDDDDCSSSVRLALYFHFSNCESLYPVDSQLSIFSFPTVSPCIPPILSCSFSLFYGLRCSSLNCVFISMRTWFPSYFIFIFSNAFEFNVVVPTSVCLPPASPFFRRRRAPHCNKNVTVRKQEAFAEPNNMLT